MSNKVHDEAKKMLCQVALLLEYTYQCRLTSWPSELEREHMLVCIAKAASGRYIETVKGLR